MRIKKKLCLILCAIMCISGFDGQGLSKRAEAAATMYSDVAEGHWAYPAISKLLELNILSNSNGKSKFGIGGNIKRSEYISMVVTAMGFTTPKDYASNLTDNKDKTKWYYSSVESAHANGLLPDEKSFRPSDNITRTEAVAIAVCGLGYYNLAVVTKESDETVADRMLQIAQDFRLVSDAAAIKQNPDILIKKEEAAALVAMLYDKSNATVNELHGFYAIKSYQQMHMIENMNSVSFGWSNIELDKNNKPVINTSSVPPGFDEPVLYAADNGALVNLMVTITTDDKTHEALLDAAKRRTIVNLIVKQVSSTVRDGIDIEFDGVTIDFENFRGDELKKGFNSFLRQLKAALQRDNKYLYVAVQPARKTQAYYDGYDFKTIGQIADRVILMAHDYQPKRLTDADKELGYTTTPVTPINEVYYALKAITDKETGVDDPQKVLLQISFDSVQLKAIDGKLIGNELIAPSYGAIYNRLTSQSVTPVETYYSRNLESPYIKFTDPDDGTDNIVWYEDSRSVAAKIKLALMFGGGGISLWRIGTIPSYTDEEGVRVHFNVWQDILVM